MREIKFRAWDKKEREHVYSGIEFELRCLKYPCKYGENNKWGSDSIGFININDVYFVVEQHIDVEDKNGKAIYEGDIVKIHLGLNSVIEKSVIWDDENCCFTFQYTHENIHNQFSGHYEVIGNIHEKDNQ